MSDSNGASADVPRITQAAILVETAQPLQILDVEIPALQPGQVLVDVAFSGVCHTQLSEVRGRRGPDRFLPHTLGHEGAGTVVEVGEEVKKVQPGDRVVLSWIKGSGADVPSTKYQSRLGGINSGAISTFMRRTVTCENRLTKIPDDMPLREAALLGCAVPTGAGIVFNSAEVRPGDSVAVFGAGGIGLSAIAAAALMNANPIIAIDIHDDKLAKAREMGATHTLNASSSDLVAQLRALTGGKGVDCAIEAVGRQDTMEAAYESVRDGGGLCVLAGNLPFGEKLAIDPMNLIKGKRITGTWGGESNPDRDIPLFARLFLNGRLRLDGLITHEFSLEEINESFDALESGSVARALIRMN